MRWLTILVLATVFAAAIIAALPFASGYADDDASVPIFDGKIPAGYATGD
jgi:hypothetical protein